MGRRPFSGSVVLLLVVAGFGLALTPPAASARSAADVAATQTLAHAAKVSSLKFLNFQGTKITDDGLAALEKMPEKLDILPSKLPLLRQFISSRLAP